MKNYGPLPLWASQMEFSKRLNSNKSGSDNRVLKNRTKFLSMKKRYYTTIVMYFTITRGQPVA
jgi:hypothetical protein